MRATVYRSPDATPVSLYAFTAALPDDAKALPTTVKTDERIPPQMLLVVIDCADDEAEGAAA